MFKEARGQRLLQTPAELVKNSETDQESPPMSLKAPLAAVASACLAILTHSNAAHSAALPSVYDWITKDVCADASNQPVAADPYDGCPAGTTERDIQIGEALPYLNHDQPYTGHPDGYQRHDRSEEHTSDLQSRF